MLQLRSPKAQIAASTPSTLVPEMSPRKLRCISQAYRSG
jgi:hypothetical protein